MSVRRNILAGWFAHLVTLLVGLFLVRYVKDLLGDAGYGAWIFVSSVAGYAGLLYAGFGAAICRYTAKHHAREDWDALNRVASSIFAVYATNSLIALLGSVVFAWVAPSVSDWEGQSLTDVRITILLIGLGAMSGMLGSVFGGVLIGIHRFDIKRVVQISGTLLRLVLVVSFLHVRPGLVSMAAAFLAVTIFENVVYYLAVRRLLPTLCIHRRLVSREVFRECLPFVSWNAVGMVSEYLIYLTDTVVIGCMLGTAAVTPYYIALRLCQMIRLPIENVAEAAIPKAGELHTRGESRKLRDLVFKTTGVALLLMGGFAIGTAWFGGRLIFTWLGPGNESSVPILQILIAAQLVALPLLVPRKVLLAMGLVRIPSLFDVLQAVTNLALSLVLVRYWGVAGVAWGTLIPIALFELTLLLPYVCRTLQITARELLAEIITPQVLPFTLLVAYCETVSRLSLPQTWPNLLGIAACGGGLLIGSRGALHLLQTRRKNEQPDSVPLLPHRGQEIAAS